MDVLFVASENGALPGVKVGGVADVVRDLPAALADAGCRATVINPSYGYLHERPGARKIDEIEVTFAGEVTIASVWSTPGENQSVRNLVVEHERFSRDGVGVVYFADKADTPFASDANKFSFFCTCVAAWIAKGEPRPDVVHLHDWHSAFYLLLREFDPRYEALKGIPTVFTIHNLSYQGVRPLKGHASSLESWFPKIKIDKRVIDPDYPDCVNPMLAAIQLADKLITVSPSYAEEICRPSDPDTAFFGGERLEPALRSAKKNGRLSGILNGVFYDQQPASLDWADFMEMANEQLLAWLIKAPNNKRHQLALKRLQRILNRPKTVLTSIGRLVAQKATLLTAPTTSGEPAIADILSALGSDGVLIIVGSGEPEFEQAIFDIARQHDNLVFINGYAAALADELYELGDLFLMPSSFEPCGISQMLAMRAGQPCVVHGVGGLADTVEHLKTGFVFKGRDLRAQANAFVAATTAALRLKRRDPKAYEAIRQAAKAKRFEWRSAAEKTIESIYGAENA